MSDIQYNNIMEVRGVTKEERKSLLGKYIRENRVNNKITQTDLSSKIGISRTYLSDVENGRYMPSVEMLIRLSSELKLDFNFLIQKSEIQEV